MCSVILHLSICLSDCRETRSILLLQLMLPDWRAFGESIWFRAFMTKMMMSMTNKVRD